MSKGLAAEGLDVAAVRSCFRPLASPVEQGDCVGSDVDHVSREGNDDGATSGLVPSILPSQPPWKLGQDHICRELDRLRELGASLQSV